MTKLNAHCTVNTVYDGSFEFCLKCAYLVFSPLIKKTHCKKLLKQYTVNIVNIAPMVKEKKPTFV
jgi:hypothetical protein